MTTHPKNEPNQNRINYLAVQGPHGQTFPTLKKIADSNQYMFTNNQLELFQNNGFIHNIPILSAAQMVHGSHPNNSDRPRRALVLNYMADGTVSAAPDGNLMPGFDMIPEGKKIEGNGYPLVIDLENLS